ncbi:MAG: SPOR domain-containing protein [Nitrospirae bacterium]|nr:SPOR domain-containing protein [Nitrospirota bacterium]
MGGALLALSLLLPWPALASDDVDLNNPYAIQLRLASTPITPDNVAQLPVMEGYRLYVSTYVSQGITWYRLRMGFFSSNAEAAALQPRLEQDFPGSWVTRVSMKERKASAKQLLAKRAVKGGFLARLFGGGDKAVDTTAAAANTTAATAATAMASQAPAEVAKAAVKAGETPRQVEAPYAIQLMLTKTPIDPNAVPRLPEMTGYRVYVSTVDRGGITWYQLRIGFFTTAAEATALQPALEKKFPGNWVMRTPQEERLASANGELWAKDKPAPEPAPAQAAAEAGLAAPPVRTVRPITPKVDLTAPYAIQLMLSETPISPTALPQLPVALRAYRLYVAESAQGGKAIYQLRLGFFTTTGEASQYQRALAADFPGNWVTKVPIVERRDSVRTQIQQTGPAPAPATAQRPLRALTDEEEKTLIELMDQGRKAITRGDYPRAIQIYTKVLTIPDHSYQQDAQEFLGLARERNGQFAHAKAEYERYLEVYPEGTGADRVRQRLAGLVTATRAPQERLKKSERRDQAVRWDVGGGINQYYRYDVNIDQDGNQDVLQSALSSDLDVNLRRRGGALNVRTRLSADHRYDFLSASTNNGSASAARITTLYVDLSHRSNPWSGRLGRQTQTSGGVLGRYDGFNLGYRLAPRRQLNLVAGFPVDIANSEQITYKRYFVGINADLGTYADAWDFNLFAIQQIAYDAVVDRRAVGTEVRYFRPNRSLFGLFDYDIMFGKVNTMLLLGNLTLPDKSTLSLTIDVRKSPVLTTSNALQGQPYGTIETMRYVLGVNRTREVALDRTPTSRTLTLGATHPINGRVQINADVTVSKLGGTPASEGVLAVAGTGDEFFINTQMIVNHLIRDDDVTILGARYANTSTATSTSLNFNMRYPVGNRWRINPRAHIDYRDNFTDKSKLIGIFPSIRADYRLGRLFQLEMETGGDWSGNFFNGAREDTYGYYATLGYRINF